MKKIEFSVKTITPTLMGGGFSQNDGIRPSEIKGIMRYWFRAIAGSVIGDDLEALKDLESKVFGSQDRKSPFRIVVEGVKDEYFENWERLPKEIAYLGFVINMNRERLNNIVREGSVFNVKFLFKNSIKEETIKLVAYSFYLATALGGFGLRARRGFGSWQIEDVNFGDLNIDVSEGLNNYAKENIETVIKKATETIGNKQNDGKLKFTNFINYKLEQIIINESNWKKLLSDLGAYYRYFRVNPLANSLGKDDFRPKHTKDYDEILDRSKREKELFNPIFGLNIIYKNKISVNLVSNGETLRRASPMFISIKEIEDKLAINLFVSVSQYFKEEEQSVKVKFNNKEFPAKVINMQNFKTITDFIDKLKIAMGGDNGK